MAVGIDRMTDVTQATSPAKLGTLIHLQPGFCRSINLNRDCDSLELISHYRPGSRALDGIRYILSALAADSSDRALAAIGPYGAGKSAFALFVGALLAAPNSPARQATLTTLRQADPSLADAVTQTAGAPAGFLRVQISGLPDALSHQLLQALTAAAAREHLPNKLIARLRAASSGPRPMDDWRDLLMQLRRAWAEQGGAGVLIEIDELGAFLEYESQHPQQRDIHLLQLLAELAAAPGETPLLLLVMLHQAFEHYGSRLGRHLRDEWQKVQGRFATLPFLEPADQSLRLIAAALERSTHLSPSVRTRIDQIAAQLEAHNALPPGLTQQTAAELFDHGYPLHPVTLLILPHLCQKVAQNERTLFSYLASREPFGLRYRIDELVMGDWIAPWELYDYFIQNQAGGLSDPLTHYRWAEVITALERFDQHDQQQEDARRLLKTIGLLNLIGAQRGLKASPALLELCSATDIAPAIAELEAASLIQFRQFAQEYRVWQGSDFDLPGALRQALAERPLLSLADTLNTLKPLPPLVARRAAIETGTLRSYDIAFSACDRWPPTKPPSPGNAILWFYLAEPNEQPTLRNSPPHDVIAICSFTERLHEVVSDWLALQELPRHHAALHQDPVAQREHRDWLASAEFEAVHLIQTLIEIPEALEWRFGGETRPIHDRRHLQRALSEWIEQIYDQAPYLRNELINRDQPSTSAASGRNRLLTAMLKAPDQPDLGIEKSPAEKSLYLSLLKQSGLHRAINDRFGFQPPSALDPCRLRPLWDEITATLDHSSATQLDLPTLYARLQSPPFGARLGPLPVLLIAYLLAHRREVALYQEGAFCANLSPEQAELLCRRPKLFAIERYPLTGLRGDLFDRYLRAFVDGISDDPTLLDIIRPLVRFVAALPDYSLHAASIAAEATQIARLIRHAKRPGALLFEELPLACGVRPQDFSQGDVALVECFLQCLIEHLHELRDAYPKLLTHWCQQLASRLLGTQDLPLEQLRLRLAERYRDLASYALELSPVAAFIRRLTETDVRTNDAWLESVLTLLGGAPPTKWRDSHGLQARARLSEFAAEIDDLHRLRNAALSQTGARHDLMLLKVMQPQGGAIARTLQLPTQSEQVFDAKTSELVAQLDALDESTRLALIARLLQSLPEQPAEDTPDHD